MGILVRGRGEIVYVVGVMTAMEVVEPDQMRDGADRARHRMIKLRPAGAPAAEARWWLSTNVTGGA